MKKFYVSFGTIYETEVVSETEKTITISWYGKTRLRKNERKAACVFDTFEQAKECLIEQKQRAVESAIRNVTQAEKSLREAKALKKPYGKNPS